MFELSHATRPYKHTVLVHLRSALRTHAHKAVLSAVFLLATCFVFSWSQLRSLSHNSNRWLTVRFRTIFAQYAHPKRLETFILLALAAWLVLTWSHLLETILQYYNPLPIWDYWRVVTDLNDIEALRVRVLWHQHNEHRIIFPEIVFAADVLVFRGLQILPLILSFLCYLGMWVVITRSLMADTNLSSGIRVLAILLAGILMGWRGCAQVVGVPFLLQWTLLQVMVFLALALMARAKANPGYAYLAASIACAVVANYSAANGLLLWAILLLAAWVLRLTRRQLFTLATAAVISSTAFFIGYHPTGSLKLRNYFIHPMYSLKFVFSYLGVPFGLIQLSTVGVSFGLLSLVTFGILCTIAARNRLLASQTGIVLFGSYLFTLSTAVLISSGRMDPTDPTFLAAKAERFVTIPLVTWAVLIAASLWVTYRRGWKITSYAVALGMLVLLLEVLPKTRVWVQSHDNVIREQQWAALSIESGIFDSELVRKIYPDPNLVAIYLPELRRYHVSIYSFLYSKWFLQPVNSIFASPRRPAGAGNVTQVYPLRGGLEVLGWADGVQRATYLPKVIFTNDGGQIAGFGRRLKLGLPVGLASPQTPSSIAWIGFIKLTGQGKSYLTYVLDRRTGTLTLIGSPMPYPPVQAAAAEDIGPPVPNIAWEVKGAWTRNLLPPGVDAGKAPPEFLASWSGSDENTGSIVSAPLAAPPNHCLILPILHGPIVDGLSATLVNSDTNEVVASSPMHGAGTQWRFWRVRLDEQLKQFRIVAEDQGHDWGEWLAVGTPSECR